MIHPEYLASLRKQHRAELVLVLVQMEQVTPGWWETLGELADELGTDRQTLNRALTKLEKLGLILRLSTGTNLGTWCWWVKRHRSDQPKTSLEPSWTLRDIQNETTERLLVRNRWQWAKERGIPRPTFQGFLEGRQRVLRQRWEIIGSPFDKLESDYAA